MSRRFPSHGQPAPAAPAGDTPDRADGERPRPDRDRNAIGRTGPPREVSAAFETCDPFAAYVAHELRTPLATQRALLELALGDPRVDVASWREIGEDVLRACMRQERLLEACLVLVRSQGKQPRCEPVDLADVAGEALLSHDLRELESVVVLGSAPTTGDPDLLAQLAANLVSNAIRHNSVAGRIEVATRVESGRAVLSVTNSGALIPAGELPRLFQAFQRLAPGRPDTPEGFGLGLAIVQAIADAHTATVTARARTGGGLEIDVSFPGAPRRNAASTGVSRAVRLASASAASS